MLKSNTFANHGDEIIPREHRFEKNQVERIAYK